MSDIDRRTLLTSGAALASTPTTRPAASTSGTAAASASPTATTRSKDPLVEAFGGDGKPMGEPAAIYIVAFAIIMLAGPGKFSLDATFFGGKGAK